MSPQFLIERMLGHQRFELGDQLGTGTSGEVGLEPFLQRTEPRRVECRAPGSHEGDAVQPDQGRSAPKFESNAQQGGPGGLFGPLDHTRTSGERTESGRHRHSRTGRPACTRDRSGKWRMLPVRGPFSTGRPECGDSRPRCRADPLPTGRRSGRLCETSCPGVRERRASKAFSRIPESSTGAPSTLTITEPSRPTSITRHSSCWLGLRSSSLRCRGTSEIRVHVRGLRGPCEGAERRIEA